MSHFTQLHASFLNLQQCFLFFLQVVVGERIRPSLYNVSNSFYLRSCLDDFMFIWAIHQLISGYIYQLSSGVLQSTFLCCNWCILHSIFISIVQQSLFIFFYLFLCLTDYIQEGCNMSTTLCQRIQIWQCRGWEEAGIFKKWNCS